MAEENICYINVASCFYKLISLLNFMTRKITWHNSIIEDNKEFFQIMVIINKWELIMILESYKKPRIK